MVSTISNRLTANRKQILAFATTLALCTLPEVAFAQTAGGGGLLCWIADYFKMIIGSAALVAIFMWALEHIFGIAKLHDMVMKVGVGCGIVIVAAAFIRSSGLVVTCSGFN